MAILNLGACLSSFLSPASVGLFVSSIHYTGIIWLFAGLYVVGALLAVFLRLPTTANRIHEGT